jgi:uncharacterized protein with HEPN domain
LAHGHDGCDFDILWDVIQILARDLLEKIEPMIEGEQTKSREPELDISDEI